MANERSRIDATEEAGSTPVAGESEHGKKDRRGFLGSARRNLSEEEASSPAGRRWLIAELERLDAECATHTEMAAQHNDLRVKLAGLEEANKKSKWLEIVSFVSSNVGAAGIGAAPSYMTAPGLAGVGWVFLIGSSILIIVSLTSKLAKS